MIKLTNLTKKYETSGRKVTVLRDINLEVKQGESLAIMGKSGAGKTTLMNILGGVDEFDGGEYYFDNQSMKGLKDNELSAVRNEKIGFILQDFGLVNDKTALFNVTLPMYFDKTPYKNMKKMGIETLDFVDMKGQENKKINQLSGGQKQRVAIARAIIKKPKLILADEPTGALDSETGKKIMETLMDLNKTGITVIIVTHDEEVANYCERKITIADGKIID